MSQSVDRSVDRLSQWRWQRNECSRVSWSFWCGMTVNIMPEISQDRLIASKSCDWRCCCSRPSLSLATNCCRDANSESPLHCTFRQTSSLLVLLAQQSYDQVISYTVLSIARATTFLQFRIDSEFCLPCIYSHFGQQLVDPKQTGESKPRVNQVFTSNEQNYYDRTSVSEFKWFLICEDAVNLVHLK